MTANASTTSQPSLSEKHHLPKSPLLHRPPRPSPRPPRPPRPLRPRPPRYTCSGIFLQPHHCPPFPLMMPMKLTPAMFPVPPPPPPPPTPPPPPPPPPPTTTPQKNYKILRRMGFQPFIPCQRTTMNCGNFLNHFNGPSSTNREKK